MTQYKLASAVLLAAMCWPALAQSNPKATTKALKPLLCPSEKAPKKILGIYTGRFSNIDRQDAIVIHSPCGSADKSTRAHVSWFYFKDKEPVRLSRSNLYREMLKCIESKHHDKNHVYCLTRTKSSNKISLEAIRFYNSYRTGLTALLHTPRKTKCTREHIINDEPKTLKANGSVIEVESAAKSCVKAGKKFKMTTVKVLHRVEVTSGDYVSSHRAKNAKTNLLLDKSDHDIMSQSRYRRRPYRRYPTSQPRAVRKKKSYILGSLGTTGVATSGLTGTGRGGGGLGVGTIGLGKVGTVGYGRGTGKRHRPMSFKSMVLVINKKRENGIAKKVLRQRTRSFQYCLERELSKSPPKKKLTLTMTIEGQGKNQRFSTITAKDKTKGKVIPAASLRCLERIAKRLTFPKETFGKKTPYQIQMIYTYTPKNTTAPKKKAPAKKKK